MGTFKLNLSEAKKRQPLSKEQKLVILAWFEQNPTADLNSNVKRFMKEYNCSEMDIYMTFTARTLGII